MKKSLVAVSVIVALGAVWSGMSWYTGKQLESRLNRFIEKANTELKNSAPENGFEWQAKDFKRGIFSSDVRLILTTKGGIEEAGIKPNEEVIFKSTIDHGPFPIANLKTFNLVPKMASIHSELEQSDTLKELFNLTDGKQLLKSDVNISYSGAISANIDFVPIKHTKSDKGAHRVLSFAGAKINVNTNSDLSVFSFSAKSDGLSFSEPAKKETISLKGIDFKGDSKKGNFDIYVGDHSYSIGEFSVNGTNEHNISLKGIKVTTNSSEDKENLNIKIASSIDGVKIKDIEFGSGTFNLGMEKLDGQSVHKFTQAYNEAAQKALATNGVLSDDAILNDLHLLMNKNPQFSISPLSWKNSKGESSVDFKITLQNFPKDVSTLSLIGSEEIIRTLVKDLSLNINVPKAMLIESIAQADELNGKDKATAEIEAERQVLTVAVLGSKFLTVKNGVIGLNFHYANDKVKLNDKESSLHQFLLDNGLSGSYDDTDGIESQHDDKAELPVVE
ncbi:YdgA family protein [Xenorhabdus japonica]|uniref:Uncharacterized conserved protein YdgA, DUF945 family n=1 Tax=Xenorhabdus japonica TaxID=53341 RepID=A0A1I4ZZ15_9GAMM|nr:YdgA family protein [Xenorhabdus japonica]SFN55441.1 Uncharacterized conserved protein YdgA, DUF945 family [Xenorhabdus japonica]